jgi:hypothetical protein
MRHATSHLQAISDAKRITTRQYSIDQQSTQYLLIIASSSYLYWYSYFRRSNLHHAPNKLLSRIVPTAMPDAPFANTMLENDQKKNNY